MTRNLGIYVGLLFAWFGALAPDSRADIQVDLGRGSVTVHIPSTYDPNEAAPLFVMLHGYSSSGAALKNWWQLDSLSEQFGFIYTAPDGTRDLVGQRFWNATDSCCNFFGSNVDDSGYLRALIEEIQNLLNINPRRIHVLGHSNGGFMAYRMACDHSDLVAGIVSLAGATFFDPSDCNPANPIHVLQIHGTADNVILYNGGDLFGVPYPGAQASATTWVGYNGCSTVPDSSAPNLNLVANIPGDETSVLRWEDQCVTGGSSELWTMQGGEHSPILSAEFSPNMVNHLLAHPKPGQWQDLGLGLAGTNGVPQLTGSGALAPEMPAELQLTGALESAMAILVVGFSRIDAPFAEEPWCPMPTSWWPA